jgi:hypothetical protein
MNALSVVFYDILLESFLVNAFILHRKYELLGVGKTVINDFNRFRPSGRLEIAL